MANPPIRPRLWNRRDPDWPRCRKTTISIMRPGRLGNPFVAGYDGSRQEVIAMFEAHARSSPELMCRIAQMDDLDLICNCAPAPCHGDVILKIWDELHA